MVLVRFLNPKSIAQPPGYTSVVETMGPGRTVYIAGQLGVDLDNKFVGAPGDFRAQCVKAFENLGLALAAVGGGFKDVIKITNYLVDIADIATFRAVRDSFLDAKAPPASTTMAISQLARPGGLFEIEAIAVLPPAKARKASVRKTSTRETSLRKTSSRKVSTRKAKAASRRKRG